MNSYQKNDASLITIEGNLEHITYFNKETQYTVARLKPPNLAGGVIELPHLRLDVIVGDARETVPLWPDQADAWFLDGFAPAKNPQLWEPGLLAEVARHTRQNGTCATYTAAGFVRRGLRDAGFAVERAKGYGRKRHMTTGRLP